MAPVRAVVFDIGNVLLGWQPEAFFDRTIGPERRAALFAEVDLHGMNLAVDKGTRLDENISALRAAHPDWADEIQIWQDRWHEMLGPVLTESVEILRALRAAGMPVYALSNFGADTFEIARQHHAFLDEFDLRFISGQLGVVKPDPRIYAIVENATPFAPEALLFTDDNAANIAMAASRGWKTHLFTGPAGLKDALHSYAIEV